MLAEGLSCGLHRIDRLMRLQAIKARTRRRRLPHDLGERQATAVAPNVLERTFDASAPNRKWIADFTYVWTAEGSRPSGERFPDHAALLIVTCDGKATPHPFLAEAQDAPQLSPTFPTQTVVCTGDAQNTAEWVVRCAKLWNAESPTRRLTRNGSDSYAPWWRQF